MAATIVIAGVRSGVGKTTSSVNLAASLAATRKKVLLVDIDPQGNATSGAGVDKYEPEYTVHDVLMGDVDMEQALVGTPEDSGFDLIAANGDLTAAEVQLLDMKMREFRLRNALARIRGNYDYIIVDCPPSLNMLTVNALTAADSVIVPIQCEYYALEGLSSLLETVRQIRDSVNPGIQIEGLLRTMFDPRNRLSNEVSAQLIKHFEDKVYQTIIPRNVRLAEAPSFGVPIMFHDPRSAGARAYKNLAREIIRLEATPQAGTA